MKTADVSVWRKRCLASHLLSVAHRAPRRRMGNVGIQRGSEGVIEVSEIALDSASLRSALVAAEDHLETVDSWLKVCGLLT